MNTKAVDAAPGREAAGSGRASAARVGALACGLAFLAVGWVWAYGIALLGVAFGMAGYAMLAAARRWDRAPGPFQSRGQRALRCVATWTLWLATLASAIALVATLAAN